ncbi:tyrosine-type recombinase/integrase [Acetobacteraceae bacterium H6797]|nr:tyrosine-type recombinase/integrase [Acetobacteraceae bacterium H6797]
MPEGRPTGQWREWTPKGSTKVARFWVPAVTPHDLRHTYSTWHYCVHRDLLRLRHEGGWSTVKMVERYAHLMPEVYRSEIIVWKDSH